MITALLNKDSIAQEMMDELTESEDIINYNEYVETLEKAAAGDIPEMIERYAAYYDDLVSEYEVTEILKSVGYSLLK